MTVLSGAEVVLPDRVLPHGSITIDAGRIAAITELPTSSRDVALAASDDVIDCLGLTIVPGFIDAHIHGVDGVDTLDDGDAVARIAAALPRYGVTAFCPTTVACGPDDLRRVLEQVRACRASSPHGSARVLGAHLESNFISPDYCGAQPATCLRTWTPTANTTPEVPGVSALAVPFTSEQIRDVIDAFAADVATVTLAPEIDGGMALIEWLVPRGIRVSLGHSGADAQATLDAVARGARQVTHLFNAMTPMHHRRPGLAGIALERRELAAELICDGIHVHPAMVRLALAAKGASGLLAVSDATAAANLDAGQRAHLGGREICAADDCARLADGTMAGSTTTLDSAFRRLTREMHVPLIDAVQLCATTPARELDLRNCGLLAEGAAADLVVLDADAGIVSTYISGVVAYSRAVSSGNSRRTASV